MTFSSSTFKPKLNDQEYMELVFENGQILAKSQRFNVSLQNQRTESIMDLYEAEYNEDFMKSDGFIKNFGDTQIVPQYHHVKSNKHVDDQTLIESLKASSSEKKIEFIPPDEQSVVAEWSVQSRFETSSVDFSEDSEGSTSLSSSLYDMRTRVRARTRKRNAETRNSPERKQRENINKKMRNLKDLLPNSHKDDNESLLDEAINYMTNLQLQVQMMNRFVAPSMMMPLGPHYYSHMGMVAPQFLPVPVLNHPGLMPMQNSPLFMVNHINPLHSDSRSSSYQVSSENNRDISR